MTENNNNNINNDINEPLFISNSDLDKVEEPNIQSTIVTQVTELPVTPQIENKVVTPKKVKAKNKKQGKRHPILYAFFIALLAFASGFAGDYISKEYFKETATIKKNVNYEPVEHLTDKGLSLQQIAEYNMQAVVEIKTETSVSSFFQQDFIQTGAGSGVIISEDGYIVTNNHVIEGANTIIVKLSSGDELEAELIGTDPKLDIAVLKIDKEGLTSAVFGDSDKLKIGDEVIAIGNPLGEFGGSVTDGIISGKNREITVENQSMTLLQTNAQINKGNSGGGLFDGNGNLIGIVVAKSAGTSVEGLGFAIPINDAQEVIEQLISHGYVANRPTLGVSISEVPHGGIKKAGVYIVDIIENSPAEKAGLQIEDRIISVDNIEITIFSDLSNYLSEKKVNDVITVSVVRNGEIKSFSVTLGDSSISKKQ